jgi:hypothetical protein
VAGTGNVVLHGDGPAVVVTGAVDGPITVDATQYVVEAAPLRPMAVPVEALAAPSRLLAARHEVADFVGRRAELASLAAWRDDPTYARMVRLVHGPGGQGKTRLVTEFARACAESGWRVVRARHDSTLSPDGGYRRAAETSGEVDRREGPGNLLVIVDYAERWPVNHLLKVISGRLLQPGRTVRIVLVARPAGSWWQGLRHELVKAGFECSTLALDPVTDDPTERLALYNAALDAFAKVLRVAGGVPEYQPDLTDPAWQLILTVHMAALASVDAARRGVRPPTDPQRLSAYLLDREHAYWQALHLNGRIASSPTTMARAAYTATMTRPLPRDVAVSLLDQIGLEQAGQSVDDHSVCYPPTDPETVLEPLFPDRLGEDFLALSTPGHQVTSYVADPWAGTAATHLLANPCREQTPAWVALAVTVLVETARRWPHIATRHLYPLLRHNPHLAVGAGSVYQRLVSCGTAPAEVACALTELAVDLTNLGRRAEATATTQEAVGLYRQLASADPVAYEPLLATVLTTLSIDLSGLGQHQEALASGREAIDIRRRLAQAQPQLGADLATALQNFASKLLGLDLADEAVATAHEAVGLCRRLAAKEPVRFEPALARALWTLASIRARIGSDLPRALTEIEECLGRYGSLVAAQSEPIHTEFRSAQLAKAAILDGLGRPDDASALRDSLDRTPTGQDPLNALFNNSRPRNA